MSDDKPNDKTNIHKNIGKQQNCFACQVIRLSRIANAKNNFKNRDVDIQSLLQGLQLFTIFNYEWLLSSLLKGCVHFTEARSYPNNMYSSAQILEERL